MLRFMEMHLPCLNQYSKMNKEDKTFTEEHGSENISKWINVWLFVFGFILGIMATIYIFNL